VQQNIPPKTIAGGHKNIASRPAERETVDFAEIDRIT